MTKYEKVAWRVNCTIIFMASQEAVRLGLMSPLSGIVSMYGNEIINAGEIACREVNEAGGVLGRPLQIIIEDDGSLPETAVRAATKLVTQKECVAIIGNLLSNSRIAVAYRIAEPKRVPYLNFSFYEGSILSRYFFHFAALPNQQIDQMIPYMKHIYGPKMYFCGNNYEWSRGSIDAAKRVLNSVQGQLVGEEYYPIGISSEDIEGLLERIAASDVNVLVPYFAGSDQLRFLTCFSKKGLKKKMAIVMGHYDEMMANYLSPAVREGFYSCNTYFMTIDTPENWSFLKRLSALPGIDGIWPHGNGILTNFGEGAYLCVKAFALATNLAETLDREEIVRALETISLKGPQGLVQMDAQTHHARVNTYLSSCQSDGTFKIIKKFGSIPPVIPIRYRQFQIADNPPQEEDIRLQSRIVERMTEAVYLVNVNDDTIVYVNPGFEKIFGYRKREILGKSVSHLTACLGNSSQSILSEISKTLYRQGLWKGELLNLKKDGSCFWGSVSMSCFTHAQFGEVWLAILHDISDRKYLEENLRKYSRELEEEIAEKKRVETKLRKSEEILTKQTQELSKSIIDLEQYAYIASHDLKEPLRMVKSYSDLLALRYKSKLDARANKYIGYIIEGATRMMELVSDLFSYASIDREIVNRELVNMKEVLEVALKNLKSTIRSTHARFELETLPVLVTSRSQMTQVFQHLVDNALKFRRQGVEPRIRISAKRNPYPPFEWIFSVEDNGIGIEAQYSERVFLIFRRLHEREKYPGTGCGLAICKRIIEGLGGKIWFTSQPGVGTTFYFSILSPGIGTD